MPQLGQIKFLVGLTTTPPLPGTCTGNFVGVLGCSFLKLLNVEGCPGITAVGVAAVVQGCPHMKEFKVGSREEEDEDDEDDNDDDDDDNDD